MSQSVSASSSQGGRLPIEILVAVLRNLGVRELLYCRSTCKGLRAIIDTVPELQYSLDLSVYGLVEIEASTSVSSLDIQSRRKRLSNFWTFRSLTTNKWQTLPPSVASWVHNMFRITSGLLLYTGNVLLTHTRSRDVPVYHYSMHCLALVREDTDRDPRVEVISWSRDLEPFWAFGADPSQDLLVVVRRCFDSPGMRRVDITTTSLSQRAVYDRDTIIQANATLANSTRRAAVLIHGSLLVLILTSASDMGEIGEMEAIFIDHVSGTIIGNFRQPSHERTPNSNDFRNIILLDATSFIVLCFRQTYYTLDLYTISRSNTQANDGQASSPFIPVASFQLPSFAPGTLCALRGPCCTTSFQPRYHPQPGHLHDLDSQFHQSPLIFDNSARNCLLHMGFLYSPTPPLDSRPRAESMEIRHVIHPAVFFAAIQSYRSGACDHTSPYFVPWAQWGPRNSRSFRMRSSAYNEFASYGSRVLLTDGAAGTSHILDFNTLPYARRVHLGETISAGAQLVGRDEPTVISHGYIFNEDLVGTLPYYKTEHISPAVPGGTLWRRVLDGDIYLAQTTMTNFQQAYEILP